ncbi:MAG: winged helix-turn-helix domain-containing protein, partial [Terracidiphilus sp.]
MGSSPAGAQESIRFGEDFQVDLRAFELRQAGRVLKLERLPLQVLVILIEQKGQLVTREEIAEKIWGKDVFLDTDNSINGAVRKIRQVLKDDPQEPRFVETLTGRGYRFIA